MDRNDDRIESELCLRQGEVVRLIPEVRPNVALQTFREVILDVLCGEHQDPIPVSLEEVRDAHRGDNAAFEPEVITPAGARLLKRLFEAGMIPQRRKASPKDLSALEAYIASEPDLVERSRALRTSRTAAKEARDAAWRAMDERAQAIAADPGIARAEEISAALIDRVFIHLRGYGAGGTIRLAGMECHKMLDRYLSNSGKTRSTTAVCWWIDEEGQRHGDPAPLSIPNRRSDPTRNWGLGRD
ncbi:hypothetical protein [Defluviimonas salinarum]|uniref:Restriction system protein Mrr-like N-terminal domain-containing protein n=1 Tax=Defluviimonas salinarum TaxID=2992147 RepID=A0ABT3J5P6_9RHOB|nr:hypothetical protein [Defluviimonas salinarum]MCW3782999.1 hypothetical protein [Defluviimonas salinarum]